MTRVLLVNMPLANLRWPNLGLSLLAAGLERRGIACDVAYLNFDLAEQLGWDHYAWLADHFAFVLGGERLFAKLYFGERLAADDAYWHEVLLAADAELTAADRRDYEATLAALGPYLDRCAAACDWSAYDVVGFTCSFQQTLASLCLARRIKQLRPQTTICFGGAACEGEMGVELLRQFAEIDYVFLGEADVSFPAVVAALAAGGPVALPPGVVGRANLATVAGDLCRTLAAAGDAPSYLVRDLDALPDPDFDAYFARLDRSSLHPAIDPLLYFETSRGCWWGQKHHCAFCGLNGGRLAFRSKSPQRAIDELRRLVARYGVHRAASADNNLDPRYFRTLLPMLAAADFPLAFEFELTTNLGRPQVDALLAAGLGAAQLGIETFSTPILKLIGKGANALENLQTLKWMTQAGIEVKWNFLIGIPHEPPGEYAAMAALLPSLVHLAPPGAVGRARMDRFSPFYERPDDFGLVHRRPNRAFGYVYPFPPDVLARLAYYFEFDFADGREPLAYAAATLAELQRWQQLAGTVTLRAWDRPDGVLIITDTRPCAAALQTRLTGLDRAIYQYCDVGRTLPQIAAFAAEVGPAPPPGEPALQKLLDQWLAARLVAQLDGRFVSLALQTSDD